VSVYVNIKRVILVEDGQFPEREQNINTIRQILMGTTANERKNNAIFQLWDCTPIVCVTGVTASSHPILISGWNKGKRRNFLFAVELLKEKKFYIAPHRTIYFVQEGVLHALS
jgi:hypothetical protein